MSSIVSGQARGVYRALLRASRITFQGKKSHRNFLKLFSNFSCIDRLETLLGDIQAQSQFNHIIRTTFSSPTLTSPVTSTPVTPEPTSCSNLPPPTPSPSSSSTSSSSETASTSTSTPQLLTPEEYQEKLKMWKDVAEILMKNVVQGRLDEEEAYREHLPPTSPCPPPYPLTDSQSHPILL